MSPDPGLNIITGETGAGKSILLGAIGLLLGNRADTRTLYDSSEKCIIEGTFNLAGYEMSQMFEDENIDFSDECIVRREITVSGKSRAFINDTPVNLDTLKNISNQLLDIHSQNDTILLGNNDFQLQIIDSFAGNGELLIEYKTAYQLYRQKVVAFENLKKEAAQLRRESDYDQFLYEELYNTRIEPDEQDSLEKELNIIENAAEIKEKLSTAHQYLDNSDSSALELLKGSISHLNQAARLVPTYESLRERAQSCLIELRDIADEISELEETVYVDPARVEVIQDRLNIFYNLLKKHQASTLPELLDIQNRLGEKLHTVMNLDDALQKAEKELDASQKTMIRLAESLSKRRAGVLDSIRKLILERLTDLGIPNANIQFESSKTSPGPSGIDTIVFLFSSNKGIVPQELKQVASGGEFSRLMMVIKYIVADKRKLPTIIFDEIDTGVSGEIAKKMGKMMLNMAQKHQIIAITHLHQIASSGKAHYFVYKDHSSDKTVSSIKRLTSDERVMEIAQMIGGHNPSEAIISNAREMILKD